LQDYLAELKARGFDGFSDADLTTYVNRGYFAIAKKSKWYWEQTTDTVTIAPPGNSASLWPGGTELPYFKSLDKVYVTNTGFRRKLDAISDKEFFEDWFFLDPLDSSNRGEPNGYYVYEGALTVWPPPASSRDLLVHYSRRVTPMVAPTDVPITPQHLDEAILDAARVRCHMRANEVSLAQLARADLEEAFDDMRDDEEELMAEQLERITADDTWL
jgi:hypothetical protein